MDIGAGVNAVGIAIRNQLATIPALTYNCGREIVLFTKEVVLLASSVVVAVAYKVFDLWVLLKPSLELIGQIFHTPLGIAITLLGVSYSLLKSGQFVSNKHLSNALMVAGVFMTVITAIYLLHYGFFPLPESF